MRLLRRLPPQSILPAAALLIGVLTVGFAGAAPIAKIEILGLSPRDVATSASQGLDTVASGLNTVGVGIKVYLKAEPLEGETVGGYEWSFSDMPSGSHATLSSDTGELVTFRPDKEGKYQVSMMALDGSMNPTEAVTQDIFAGVWVGAGVFDTHETPDSQIPHCASPCCHVGNDNENLNVVEKWIESRHAHIVTGFLSGESGSSYRVSCLGCHTVGYDTATAADNGGFDDIARAIGYDLNQIPLLVADAANNGVNNWPQLPAALQSHANIQCENCHGPGSNHVGNVQNPGHGIGGVNLAVEQCAQCHDSGSHHVKPYQWDRSGHPHIAELEDGHVAESASCTKCHTGEGFVLQQVKGEPAAVYENPSGATCSTCHDPHNSEFEHQVRIAGPATLPNGYVFQNAGLGGLCMRCHNSRRANGETQALTSNRGVHAGPQADMLAGQTAASFGLPFNYNSAHSIVVDDTCVTCHMAAQDVLTVNVGGHTFAMRDTKGTEDPSDDALNVVNACDSCHDGLDTYNRTARGDYDGDGTVEGVQDEVAGLMALLSTGITTELDNRGIAYEVLENGRIFVTASSDYTSLPEDLRRAIYNLGYVANDGSLGVHNTSFAVQMLQRSYEGVYGHPITQDYPNIELRGPVSPDQVEPPPTSSLGYVGSDACFVCHFDNYDHWQDSLHAAIYRDPRPEYVLPDFTGDVVISDPANGIPPVTFTLGGGQTGPFTVSFLGQTYAVDRIHGGKPIPTDADPRSPTLPGHSEYIGKQRYQTKIGDAFYILPLQWNPVPNMDGKKGGWVNYNIKNWVSTGGTLILNLKTKSETTNCAGCHMTGLEMTYSATTQQFTAHTVDTVIACEACHGPGKDHAQTADPTMILNPDDLPVARANEVCTQCHGRYRSTGHLEGVEMEFPFKDGKIFQPGEELAPYVVDAGGYWPDGTSKQHHQQGEDYAKSSHGFPCFVCHDPHENSNEHMLVSTARNNGLCMACHSWTFPTVETVEAHTGHPSSDPESPRCVDCHMPAVQSSAVEYDIHAHTFSVMMPQTTLSLAVPNSCAIACHRSNANGEGAVDANIGNWAEASDVTIANWLIANFGTIGQVP